MSPMDDSSKEITAPQLLEQPTEEPMLYCPRCNARLSEHKCKLHCTRCGYYMSCADYY